MPAKFDGRVNEIDAHTHTRDSDRQRERTHPAKITVTNSNPISRSIVYYHSIKRDGKRADSAFAGSAKEAVIAATLRYFPGSI